MGITTGLEAAVGFSELRSSISNPSSSSYVSSSSSSSSSFSFSSSSSPKFSRAILVADGASSGVPSSSQAVLGFLRPCSYTLVVNTELERQSAREKKTNENDETRLFLPLVPTQGPRNRMKPIGRLFIRTNRRERIRARSNFNMISLCSTTHQQSAQQYVRGESGSTYDVVLLDLVRRNWPKRYFENYTVRKFVIPYCRAVTSVEKRAYADRLA